MWRDLVRLYAIRAREFSDCVATLGQHTEVGPEFLTAWEEAYRKSSLCSEAGKELSDYLERARAVGSGKTGSPSP